MNNHSQASQAVSVKRLSILVPVYNEETTVAKIIETIVNQPWPVPIEIVAVNDASKDNTAQLLDELGQRFDQLKVFHHPHNQGKGAALRTAIGQAGGDVLAIQDADLEYDPADIIELLEPILAGKAKVVYGSRFMRSCDIPWLHRFANGFLTKLTNLLTGQKITDMETCHKVMCREAIDGISIRSNRFGVEPELTAKISRRGYRIVELPISYNYRSYEEGKKIGWWDGLKAIGAIIYFRFAD